MPSEVSNHANSDILRQLSGIDMYHHHAEDHHFDNDYAGDKNQFK